MFIKFKSKIKFIKFELHNYGLYVAYIGPKSRTERPRKTRIDIEVAHVTRDSDTSFEIKRSKLNLLLMS